MSGNRILFVSRDPGGTNAILPLIEPLRSRGKEVVVYGKDAALAIYSKQGIRCSDICNAIPRGTQEEADDFVQSIRPDLVVTGTSSEDFTERHVWVAAQRAGITSFAVLDQWTNYRLRLIPEGIDATDDTIGDQLILPSYFFVMDEFARDEMSALGIEREKLVASGQPFFDHIRKAGDRCSSDEILQFRNRLMGNHEGVLVVFASQPISAIHRMNGMAEDYWGYTEQTILKAVTDCLSRVVREVPTRVTLVLRLHPKDEETAYQKATRVLSDAINVVIDRNSDSSLLLKASDVVIGMFSMLLLEAAILGKPFISVQIGLKRENPLVFDRMGVVRSILTEQELEATLHETLNGERKIHANLNFPFGATDRIVRYLEEYR